ncbi:MAG TPA: PPC domain-containing DNA-binding protein [Ruminiclostridium sp.]
MENFTGKTGSKLHILRLDAGDYLLESIQSVIERENIRNAFIVSGIGTLDYCVLHMVMTTSYPAVEHFEKWENKPLELSSIDGIIADGVPHLHMVVSDDEKAYSGHLEPGCRCLYLSEIVIQEIDELCLIRKRNDRGINILHSI